MHTLDMLESFSMKGNPVTHPPLNYQTEGFPTLRNYWKRIDAAFTSGAFPSPSRKRESNNPRANDPLPPRGAGICELVGLSLKIFPREFAEDARLATKVGSASLIRGESRGEAVPAGPPRALLFVQPFQFSLFKVLLVCWFVIMFPLDAPGCIPVVVVSFTCMGVGSSFARIRREGRGR